MLESHTRQIDTTDASATKPVSKKKKKKRKINEQRGVKTEVPLWDGQKQNYWGVGAGGASTSRT